MMMMMMMMIILKAACVTAIMHSLLNILCYRITLQQNDPRWVGAWWVGFLSIMVATLLTAPAFFGYPPDPSTSSYRLYMLL